ncbi:MAG: type II secretion system F family protein [Pseudomonadota bacterium]
MDILYNAFLVLAFFAVFGILEGLYLSWNAYRGPEARRIERRLQAMSAGVGTRESSLLKQRMLSKVPLLDRLLLRLPRVHLLDRFLLQSGTDTTVGGLLGLSAILAAAGAVLAQWWQLPLWLLGLCCAGPAAVPVLWVLRKRRIYLRTIDAQLPSALELMARALQAGHAFSSALSMVATEGPDLIAREFKLAFEEISFGVAMQDALVNLSTRVDSTDLRYFVIAILIQRETGGNLAELLLSIAAMIRERQRLAGTVRVLSAEGRLSAWILGVLPFLVAGAIELVNPGFLAVVWTDPAGIRIVVGALGLMAFGVLWMWRIIAIRV